MGKRNIFKYGLPVDCPGILIKANGLQDGKYDIFYFRIYRNSPAEENDFAPQLFLTKFSPRKRKLEEENNYSQLCQMASVCHSCRAKKMLSS